MPGTTVWTVRCAACFGLSCQAWPSLTYHCDTDDDQNDIMPAQRCQRGLSPGIETFTYRRMFRPPATLQAFIIPRANTAIVNPLGPIRRNQEPEICSNPKYETCGRDCQRSTRVSVKRAAILAQVMPLCRATTCNAVRPMYTGSTIPSPS